MYRFAAAVAAGTAEAAVLGERIEARLGRTAQVDLALAIATSRFFPTVKRGLGYARSCSLVPVRIAD